MNVSSRSTNGVLEEMGVGESWLNPSTQEIKKEKNQEAESYSPWSSCFFASLVSDS